MALELDLLNGEDRPAAVPIVLKRGIIDDKLAVQPYRHLLSDHLDAERIPRPDLVVGDDKSLVGVLLVVVETAGADVPHVVGIPDLNLRSTAEIESGIAARREDAPINEHLEVLVVLLGRKRISAAQAIEEKRAIAHLPVLDHVLIGKLLDIGGLGGLGLAEFLTDDGVVEPLTRGHTLPVGLELLGLSVKKHGEALGALLDGARADIAHLGIIGKFLDADVAPLHVVAMTEPADVAFGAVKTGMSLAVRGIGTVALELGHVSLRDENAVEVHLDLAADYADFLKVPHARLLHVASATGEGLLLAPRLETEVVATARNDAIDAAGVLVFVKKIETALGVVVLAAAVIKELKLAHGIIRGVLLGIRHADAETIVAVRRQAELKAEHEVAVHLFGAQIAAATLAAAVREALKNARLLGIDAVRLGGSHPSGEILAVEYGDEPLCIGILDGLAVLGLASRVLVVTIYHGSAYASRHDGSGKSRGYNLHFYSFDKKLSHIISRM